MTEYLRVGKIINTHGLRGKLKVLPLTNDIKRFDYLKNVFVDINNKYIKLKVENLNYQSKFVILKLVNINCIDDAEFFKGKYIEVDRKSAVKLKINEYFICDLIGVSVYEDKILLGEIVNIIQTKNNDVYNIRSKEGKEILIPASKTVIQEVDIENKYMKVKLPEGI